MSVMNCNYCNRFVDTDYDVHFEADCLRLHNIDMPIDDMLLCEQEIEDYNLTDRNIEAFEQTGIRTWLCMENDKCIRTEAN